MNCENGQVVLIIGRKNDINQYLKLIEYAKEELYPGSTSFTKLSAIVKLYNLKVRNGWSDACFTQLLKLQREMLPTGNTLLEYTYAEKF